MKNILPQLLLFLSIWLLTLFPATTPALAQSCSPPRVCFTGQQTNKQFIRSSGICSSCGSGICGRYFPITESWWQVSQGNVYARDEIQNGNNPLRHTILDQQDCPANQGAVDLAFLVDTTGSMGDDIAQAKISMLNILSALRERVSNYRVAVTSYRDFPSFPYGAPGDWPYNRLLDFSANFNEIQTAVNRLSLGNGYDWPESIYAGLIGYPAGVGGTVSLSWRPEAQKIIIVIGDAPPHQAYPWVSYASNLSFIRDAFRNKGIDLGIDKENEYNTLRIYTIGASQLRNEAIDHCTSAAADCINNAITTLTAVRDACEAACPICPADKPSCVEREECLTTCRSDYDSNYTTEVARCEAAVGPCVSASADTTTAAMSRIASSTGGCYIAVGNPNEIGRAVTSIVKKSKPNDPVVVTGRSAGFPMVGSGLGRFAAGSKKTQYPTNSNLYVEKTAIPTNELSYNHWRARLPVNLPDCNLGATAQPANLDGYHVCVVRGNVRGSQLKNLAPRSVVFVEGNLTFSDATDEIYTRAVNNEYRAFIVQGKITVGAGFGRAYTHPDGLLSCPSCERAELQGVFIASQVEILARGDADPDIRQGGCDLQFNLAGSLIQTGMQTSSETLNLQFTRTFKGCESGPNDDLYFWPNDYGANPTHTFCYRPDFLLNTPSWLRDIKMQRTEEI